MNAVKNDLIKRINGYSDLLDKKEILERLIIDQKLDNSLAAYAAEGAIPQEQAIKHIKECQAKIKGNT